MKFKFSTTMLLQVSGEVDIGGDGVSVITDDKLTIIPTYMTDGAKDLQTLDDGEQKTIFGIITHNVLHRAQLQCAIPGVTNGVPVPLPKDVPPGERH